MSERYTPKDLQKILDNVSLVDYFFSLESEGKVEYKKKYNKRNYYFISEGSKYSVSDDKYFDFKSDKGGGKIKAVMEFENKSWKEAVDFLKEFGKTTIDESSKKEIAERREKIDKTTNETSTPTKIIRSIRPNNDKLLDYFINERGISKEILKENTKQVHYEANGRQYFGLGLQNQSGGYEVRNPMMKSKIGKNDFTFIQNNPNKMVVFEGMTDMLSFLQLMKKNNRTNDYSLAVLNSVTNADKFIEKHRNFQGSMVLLLDGDDAGNLATNKIFENIKNANITDARSKYGIGTDNNDLNNYLTNQNIKNQKKSSNFTQNIKSNKNENTTNTTQSKGVSNFEQLGKGSSKREDRPISSTSQSEQNDRANNRERQDAFSENVGNGLVRREELRTRRGMVGTGKEITGGVGQRGKTENTGRPTDVNSTNIPELDSLIQKYKGQKLTNNQVTELVSVACFVDENKVVQLNNNLNITDDLEELVSHYKTGGVAKQGRGVLDEYYTNTEIVDTVKNLLDKELKSKNDLSILEPSVGTGNFINAVKGLPNATINTFEINETTAKISKILYPGINVNLRSFESEFITENGTKQSKSTYENKYDVVIGNPPYGQHRGMYKGLGEEPKLSRYEDYFVKRSLDTMKENGTLAMVLPSSWIDRQKKLNNAELVNAYRLPVGSFTGTQIGTDIVLLKKDKQKQNIDISKYFEENPNQVLGEIREKTNRFGKLEEYVHGNLEEALALIEKDNLQKEETKLTPEIIEDYKELYKEAIVDSDTWKYDIVNQNLNRFNQDIVFNNIFNEILEQNKKLNSNLYDKYHNDRKFALSFSNDVKALCLKELQVKEKNVSLDDIKANKTYQAILKDSFGGVMYNEDNKTKYDEKEIVELSDLWDKLKQTEKESAGGIVKGVVAFAKEIKQDIIDKKQQNTTMPMWDEKTDTVIDVVPQEIAKEIKEKQSVQPSLFDLPKEEQKNGTYYRTFAVKKNDKTPVEEYESKDEKEILQHYQRMKKDGSNAIVDYECRVYKNDVVIDVIDNNITSNIDAENKENVLNPLSEEYKKVVKEENNVTQKQTIEVTRTALETLKNIKFKSPAIIDSIYKYENLIFNLKDENKSFEKEELEDFTKKAERIIKHHSKRTKKSEYQIQTEPKIKKGVLKYQFSKNDDIVNSSLQNNPNLTKEQIEAFNYTEYNGVLNDPNKFRKYANYSEGKWLHDFYYAEGNIYAKLEQLERDKHAIDETQYQKQKALLESVLPKLKKLDEIIISPNHEFIHKFDLGQTEKMVWDATLKKPTPQTVDYTLADKFKDFVSDLPSDAFRGSSKWEVNGFVDNENVTGSDRERNALVRERRKEVANDLFKKFVNEEMTGAEKERFVEEFNQFHNNIHIPDYSQFPLFSKIHHNFKGKPLVLSEIQKGSVGRLTTKGVGLLALEVGFGKTLAGVLAMHEAMERGTAKRPLIVVPNDTILKQWVETIYETIPNAKVNVLGNLGKNVDLSNFDNKDNEITLVTYSGFNNIGFNKEVTNSLAGKFSYISKNEMKIVKNSDDSITVKQESERDKHKRIAQKDELKGKMRKGKVYDWEDFGFDHLTFDEVHNANHIVGKVRIEDRGFASDFRSQNQRTSQLGINTWMASQYIQENYEGRNVTLLSATPFTNKPLEYYSILSLIANDRLEEKGYFNVNTFFETFMEADNEMEIDAKGDVKYKSNVKRFKNNAVFKQLLGEFIDIKGEEDNPKLVRPNRINKEYKIKQNDLTSNQYELLNDNFRDDDKGAILTHILNARLIAISPYLSPYNDDKPTVKKFVENSPKLKTTMDLIAQNKKDKSSAGQIIYSELAVDEFPKLEKYLIDEVGFNKNEVATITGKTTKAKREKIQEDFNNGKIKVIIGSSAIKEGINLQENTSDLYLLSLPYNFTQLGFFQ